MSQDNSREDKCYFKPSQYILGVQEMLWFFPRIFIILPPLPRKHWAAFSCTEIGQPVEATVHSHCVAESFKISCSDK